MGRVAGVLDDPPGFPYTPPGVDVLEGGKLTSNNVAGSSHDPMYIYPIYTLYIFNWKCCIICICNGCMPVRAVCKTSLP